MYGLMVCDGEQAVIESICHIVEKECSSIKVVGTAGSGKEAVEKTLAAKPDIILTEIKLPGINGIEAIKEIKKVQSDIKIVIISAYEFFEYAKQAVELGVSRYLIKPVRKEILADTLNMITARLDEERQKYRRELEAKERLEKMQSAAEHCFIYSLLYNQAGIDDITKYKSEFFDINEQTGFIFIMTFSKKEKESGHEAPTRDCLDVHDIYDFIKENLKHKWKCIVGPVMPDRVVVYAAQDLNDVYRQRVQAVTCIEELMHLLEEKFNVRLKAGIGRVHDDNEMIASYQEALTALNSIDDRRIAHIDDISPSKPDAECEAAVQEHKLLDALENGEVYKCLSVLSDIFRKYQDFTDQELVRFRIIEMMAAVRHIAMKNGLKDDTGSGRHIKKLMSCGSGKELEQTCTEQLRYVACEIFRRKKSSAGKIVEMTNMLINERYNQGLNLDDVSRELHISPHYLSRLYKSETGENFIDRLTSVRIENAKKLMRENRYSVKEVCYMSGYSDPNYFSKLFKKHVGVSPTDYQKQIREGIRLQR